jgi:hypothetical protein
MKLTKGLLLVALAAFIFAACKDNEDDDAPSTSTKTKTELITTGSWYVHDIIIDDTSFFSLFENCEKDDYQTFKTDGKMVTDEGPTKCDPTDPQTDSVDWKFYSNETMIIIDGDTASLTTLNGSDLVMSMHDDMDNHIVMKLKKK